MIPLINVCNDCNEKLALAPRLICDQCDRKEDKICLEQEEVRKMLNTKAILEHLYRTADPEGYLDLYHREDKDDESSIVYEVKFRDIRGAHHSVTLAKRKKSDYSEFSGDEHRFNYLTQRIRDLEVDMDQIKYR